MARRTLDLDAVLRAAETDLSPFAREAIPALVDRVRQIQGACEDLIARVTAGSSVRIQLQCTLCGHVTPSCWDPEQLRAHREHLASCPENPAVQERDRLRVEAEALASRQQHCEMNHLPAGEVSRLRAERRMLKKQAQRRNRILRSLMEQRRALVAQRDTARASEDCLADLARSAIEALAKHEPEHHLVRALAILDAAERKEVA